MAAVSTRRSVMTLYSDEQCPYCHRVRMVLAEKGIAYEIVMVEIDDEPEDVARLNPYGEVPILVDRDLVVYDSLVIMEYLDERFPHPPLMHVDPLSRAQHRKALLRIQRDWYSLIPDLEKKGSDAKVAKARKHLRESIASTTEAFQATPFFLSEDITLVDCFIAPLLWRLPKWGVKLPTSAAPVAEYANRLFSRESFQESLTEVEREMR